MQWPDNVQDARRVQERLRQKQRILPLTKQPELIAGVDAAFSDDYAIAAVCLYTFPGMEYIRSAHAIAKITFPYIPGLLSFREGPAMIKAIDNLDIKPDIILVDGQGTAHPEGMGIASHIGILLNMTSIGCAKSRLIGEYRIPGSTKGSYTYLRYRGKTAGAALRTRENVKPVFVSPGHMIDLKGAINIVLKCTAMYRIPEPQRCADRLSKKLK
jgi:deoxyribonuclease V